MDEEFVSKIQIGPEDTSLDLLQAVYRSPYIPLHTRMRAAALAIPHEHPRLSAMALVHNEGDMAERLDRAIERSNSARLVNGAKLIEAQPIGEGSGGSTAGSPSIRRV
jgi:hypothetical protein